MAVKEWEDRIVFLRRVVPGSADKSYGIHVARLGRAAAESVVLARSRSWPISRPRSSIPTAALWPARGEMPAAPAAAQLPLFTPPRTGDRRR